ncbi:hypothetical protein ACF3M2_03230 [Tissierella carlieri]|uniref:hypothetical protein n=2 Tax=Tissierella TaxID=41273 RepID=UPI0019126BA4|nr:hypothetical protein [Tissierella sp. P1]
MFIIKRTLIIIMGLILLVYLSGCSNKDKDNIYGTYKFEKVSYLTPLSSSTIDFVNEQMEDTKYTIQADLFKIQSTDYTVEFNSPKYVKEKIQNNTSVLSYDIDTLIGSDVDYQYTIYDEDGDKAKWRLYVSSDCLWVGTYVDNTANGSEIIMDIYKLSK